MIPSTAPFCLRLVDPLQLFGLDSLDDGFTLLSLHFLKEGEVMASLDFLFADSGAQSFLYRSAEPTGRLPLVDTI